MFKLSVIRNFKVLLFLFGILSLFFLLYSNSFLPKPRLIELESFKRWSANKSPEIKVPPASDVRESPEVPTLHLRERFCIQFNLDGDMFNDQGSYKKVGSSASSCLVHFFSPQLEYEAARRFLDPIRGNVYYANSPAIMWDNGELVLVARIWLDREKYENEKNWPDNQFSDNWFYTQRFDSTMRPVSAGSILGIPTPKQWWIGDGPIEPRLFKCRGRMFVSFNAAMFFEKDFIMDYTIIWDMNRNLPIIPEIHGGTPMVNATEKGDMPRDKHWMALILDDRLYFVHNLDPLRVLNCTLDGKCMFIHQEVGRNGFVFSDVHSHLRGGTPFELYEFPYYISIAHVTMFKSKGFHRYYTAHLVVLKVNPFRVVFLSNPIKIHKRLYKMAPMVRRQYIDDGFLFPVGLIIRDKDSIEIGGHINDFNGVIIRLKGLSSLMSEIIATDSSQNLQRGPPPGTLNQHIHDTLESLTHIDLVHQKV